MKNLFIVSLIMAAFFSCNSNSGSVDKNGYDIKATITGAGGKTIFLDRLTLSSATPVDTAIINSDGKFEMKGTVPEKGLYLLRITQEKTWLVVLDKGVVTLNGSFDNVFSYDVTGSAENAALTSFIKNIGSKNQQLVKLNQDFMNARTNGASEQELTGMQAQYQTITNEIQTNIQNFADTVHSVTLAAFSGSLLNAEQNAAFLDKLVQRWQKTDAKNAYLAELATKVAAFTQLEDGKVAPDFTTKTPKGETIKLSQLRGKIVLLDFWASWCRPCRMENPNVVAAYNKYKDKGFTVFSISLDDNAQNWVNAIQQDGLAWPNHGSDLKKWNSDIARQYNVNSIPSSFLIDKDGKIVGRNLRGQLLEQKLAELLGS